MCIRDRFNRGYGQCCRSIQSAEGAPRNHARCESGGIDVYKRQVHVRRDGSISLEEAHETATAVENKLKRQFGKGTLVLSLIHI